jgi:hypothetical protein
MGHTQDIRATHALGLLVTVLVVVDWSTVASLATAGGTLVLGIATFASVRSAQRAARVAERSLLAGLRPVLFASQTEDADQKVMWYDRHFAHVPGGQATLEVEGDVIYLAISVRNVGSGIAVLHGWNALPRTEGEQPPDPPPPERFRRLTRDLFVPAGSMAFWQGAIREADDVDRAWLVPVILGREPLGIDVLYGDLEGGQRTITRFGLTPVRDDRWLATVGRHWHLDRPDPR